MSAVWLLTQILRRTQEPEEIIETLLEVEIKPWRKCLKTFLQPVCSCQLVPRCNNGLDKFGVVKSKLLSNCPQLSITSEIANKDLIWLFPNFSMAKSKLLFPFLELRLNQMSVTNNKYKQE